MPNRYTTPFQKAVGTLVLIVAAVGVCGLISMIAYATVIR